MSPISATVFRFVDVTYAVGMRSTSLRHWLTRDQIKLFSERPEGTGWRTFSYADVAVIAITKALVGCGLDVAYANRVALEAADTPYFWTNTPPGALPALWRNKRLVLCPNGDECDCTTVFMREENEKIEIVDPDGAGNLFDENVIIIINIGKIIELAFARLDEISSSN